MMSCMLADDVDDRHVRPARIVQIGETIPKTGAEMKQSACRFLRHAGITICRSGYNSFEQSQNAPHFTDSVKCSNDVDFRGARVCKARVYPSGEKRAN